MKNTALITIDVQQSFPQRPYWRTDDVPAFQIAINDLIAAATQAKVPIVRVHHVEDEGVFSVASGFVKPFDWLLPQHDALIEKHVHNAFTDTGLDRWLRAKNVRRLIITGIRTEQCCETTTRVASDLGYDVDYVTEATLTFPMVHKDGRTFSAADIKAKTELVLEGRFATIRTVDEMKKLMAG
jgi:nicotinamidase-related amidase